MRLLRKRADQAQEMRQLFRGFKDMVDNIDSYRLRDLACVLLLAPVAAPLLLVTAALLRILHGRPVLFRQERVGRSGRIFEIYKFRTMVESSGPLVTVKDDPRVHYLGNILRTTKLDELPQLFNVLRGDMSLVGPRPEVRRYVEMWPDELRSTILSIRPGITDPASVEFRSESEHLAQFAEPEKAYMTVILPRKCELYVAYVLERSLQGDLRILMQTIGAVMRGRS